MQKKSKTASTKGIARIDVSAKAEAKLSVKAEVPASSVGRLVDAFTDMIRPFSEARGLKADRLRVQREEIAIEIAKKARERILIENTEVVPVANKILIPLLEKSSYEERDDEMMIERWANLLASASIEQTIPPRFVGILEELNGSQAECLEAIAFNRAEQFKAPYRIFSDASLDFSERYVRAGLSQVLQATLKSRKSAPRTLDAIADHLNRPGVFLEFGVIFDSASDLWIDYNGLEPPHNELNLAILDSLGVIRRQTINLELIVKKNKYEVVLMYHSITDLGINFVEACCRAKIQELRQIDQTSRKSKTG